MEEITRTRVPRKSPWGVTVAMVGVLSGAITIGGFVAYLLPEPKCPEPMFLLEFRRNDRYAVGPHVLRLPDGSTLSLGRGGHVWIDAALIGKEVVLFCLGENAEPVKEGWRGTLPVPTGRRVLIEMGTCCS